VFEIHSDETEGIVKPDEQNYLTFQGPMGLFGWPFDCGVYWQSQKDQPRQRMGHCRTYLTVELLSLCNASRCELVSRCPGRWGELLNPPWQSSATLEQIWRNMGHSSPAFEDSLLVRCVWLFKVRSGGPYCRSGRQLLKERPTDGWL
jgi:hypothetical protein